MKLHTVLIATHCIAAVVGVLAVLSLNAVLSTAVALPVGFGVAAAAGLSLGVWSATKVGHGALSLERAVTSGDSSQLMPIGIEEFDAAGGRLRGVVQRWAEAAANSRDQSREIERLVNSLNRRRADSERTRGPATGSVLREQLGSISRSATSELNQILECTREISRHTSQISTGSSEQSDAVNKTTTYVEQMSTNIDLVAQNAGAAQQAAVSARDSASEALRLVRELIDGMTRIRNHVEASESRLRSLGDHSQEISAIVELIGNISSRTDMLALNASIESVRAGEHGRGFAVVAEEVRKLAEQAAQASREVGGLVESIQLETQESIALMAEEREEVEAEVARVNAAGETLERISQISTDSATQVGEITKATQLQLQLTQEVVLAMEQISNIAKSSRTRAEEACWTTNTLTKLAQQFDESLSPLRECSRAGQDDSSRYPKSVASAGAPLDANSSQDLVAAAPSS